MNTDALLRKSAQYTSTPRVQRPVNKLPTTRAVKTITLKGPTGGKPHTTNLFKNSATTKALKRSASFNEAVELTKSPLKKPGGRRMQVGSQENLFSKEDCPSSADDSNPGDSSGNSTIVSGDMEGNQESMPVIDDPTINPQIKNMLLLILQENRTSSSLILKKQQDTSDRLSKLEEIVKSSNNENQATFRQFKDQIHAVEQDHMQTKMAIENRLLQLENSGLTGTVNNRLLKELSGKLELHERLRRKNNIVVKGLSIPLIGMRKGVTNFMRNNLNYHGLVIDIRSVGKIVNNNASMVVVTLESWESKQFIIRNKKKMLLNQQTVYIQPDYTPKEQEIMFQLRNFARTLKPDRLNIRYSHLKVKVKGQWYQWNEESRSAVSYNYTPRVPSVSANVNGSNPSPKLPQRLDGKSTTDHPSGAPMDTSFQKKTPKRTPGHFLELS